MVRNLILFISILILTACMMKNESTLEVALFNSYGDEVGKAIFTEHPEGVEIDLEVEGLTPGFHGIHIHEKPLCEGPDFKSAGNHWNPENKEHGLLHPEGAHLGDLPNILADEMGKATYTLMVNGATLLDKKHSLFEGEGTSIIIHEDLDDGMTQPSGGSGERVVCGVISRDES